jgi:hypothetical protein
MVTASHVRDCPWRAEGPSLEQDESVLREN